MMENKITYTDKRLQLLYILISYNYRMCHVSRLKVLCSDIRDLVRNDSIKNCWNTRSFYLYINTKQGMRTINTFFSQFIEIYIVDLRDTTLINKYWTDYWGDNDAVWRYNIITFIEDITKYTIKYAQK